MPARSIHTASSSLFMLLPFMAMVIMTLSPKNVLFVDAYVNSNSNSNSNNIQSNVKDPSLLPIVDPKLRQALEKASQIVNSPDLVVATPSVTDEDTTTSTITVPNGGRNVAVKRQRWGIDKAYENEYWFDSRIHSLGNVGFWGAVHAACAPFSTKIIDMLSYEGKDVRNMVADDLSKRVKASKTRILDLCCGVGTSTRALQNAFPDAETVIGVDTSNEMISMAQFLSHHYKIVKPFAKKYLTFLVPLAEEWFAEPTKATDSSMSIPTVGYPKLASSFTTKAGMSAKTPTSKSINIFKSISCQIPKNTDTLPTTFACGNAESTPFPEQSFNLVTIMYALHEAPREGRDKILREAHRLLVPGGTLAVVDIHSDYKPSDAMLAGEPYVVEYQKNIHQQLRSFRGFSKLSYKNIIPEHVGMWVLRRISY